MHNCIHMRTSRIVLGDFQFQFFNTDIPESEDPNEHSIVTLATIHDIHVLLMGDATTKNEDVLLKQYSLPRIQILKVGHHGSRTSSSKTFLSQIHPDIALISAGKQNMYHLPHPLTLQNYMTFMRKFITPQIIIIFMSDLMRSMKQVIRCAQNR